MRWIGLTGGLGSGKSTVSQILTRLGAAVIDADAVVRALTDRGGAAVDAVIGEFGNAIKQPDGSIDRKALAGLVFGNPERLSKLESILHPLVRQEVARQRAALASRGLKYAVYDVPLLFEKNMQSDFDLVVVVNSSLEQQRERVLARNQWSEDEFNRRMASQWPLTTKVSRANVVLNNTGSLRQLEQEVAKLKSSWDK